MKKILFIVNPKAGLKKNKNFIDDAVWVFEEAGYKVGLNIQNEEQTEPTLP